MKRLNILVLFVALLLGCQSTRYAKFNPAEYERFKGPGSSTIKGRIWLDLGPNVRVVAKDCKVILEPITSYTKEWYEREVKKGAKLGPPDPRALAFRRVAITDENGNFTFKNIPPGRYYIVTKVPFNYFDPDMGLDYLRHCILYYKIKVKAKETKRIDLTNLPGHSRNL